MNVKMKLATLFCLLLPFAPGAAEPVYRWVDADGNVGYSSQPPPDAERVEALSFEAPPPEARVEAARQRLEKERETARQLEQDRKRREQARSEQRRQRPRPAPSEPQSDDNGRYGYVYPMRPLYPGWPLHRPIRPPRPGQGMKPRPGRPLTGRPPR